jgi:hypothetical protein
MQSNTTHVIFWNPSNLGLSWEPGYRELIGGFLANVAADSGRPTNVFSLTPQYADSAGPAAYSSSFAGALDDGDPAPPSDCVLPATAPAWPACLKDTDLKAELSSFVAAHGLPTGMGELYFLVTPAGLGSCIGVGPACSLGGSTAGSFCGWHSHIGSGAATILLANIPYAAVPPHCESGNPRPNGSSADPALSTIAHEQAEAVTDPLTNAWGAANNQEIGDLCVTNFGPPIGGSGGAAYNQTVGTGHYFLQEIWSNADGACMPNELPAAGLSVKTSAPVAGVPVAVDASASSDTDGSIVSYAWQFGDGASASGATPTHTYATGGTYAVTLTVTDSDGYSATVARALNVAGASSIARAYVATGRSGWYLVVSVTGPGVITEAGQRFVMTRAGLHAFRLTTTQLAAARRHQLRVAVTFVPVSGPPVSRTVTFSTRR